VSAELLQAIVDAYPDHMVIKADGFDDALLGYAEGEERLVYSVSKCIAILMERDGMDLEEATEYFDFNVSGSHIGEHTPVWVFDDFTW